MTNSKKTHVFIEISKYNELCRKWKHKEKENFKTNAKNCQNSTLKYPLFSDQSQENLAKPKNSLISLKFRQFCWDMDYKLSKNVANLASEIGQPTLDSYNSKYKSEKMLTRNRKFSIFHWNCVKLMSFALELLSISLSFEGGFRLGFFSPNIEFLSPDFGKCGTR